VNESELKQLMLAELDSVHRLARHFVRRGCGVSVDDVVQETYLLALQGLQNFRLDADLGVRPWLFRILHRVVIRRATKDRRDREREIEVSRDDRASVEEDGAWLATANARIDWDRVDGRLAAAIEELADPLRSTFLLLAVGELSYKEIAAATDVPIGTVMSRIARARRHLIDALDELARDRGLRRSETRDERTRRPEASGNVDD
jgi:RNA polymerase sigma-70 factor (ECF subfamily)